MNEPIGGKTKNESKGKKTALVTGAAGALGSALVEQLMQAGWDCIALDRNRRGLEQFHDRLSAAGAAPLVVPLDLAGAGPQHFDQLAGSLQDQFDRLDALVHAAAEFKALTPLEHHPADDWMKTLQAGLTGPFLLSQALLPLMRATEGSRMVWVADDPAARSKAYWGAYGVAQSGRSALASILAAECRRDGPEVVEIDPGPFYSPLRSKAWPVENPDDLPTAADAAKKVMAVVSGGR
ncbi:MAG TPA: SDR family NAD(P)-dependent oxidoreductase [Wenzhouxiangellaceae bacterium]|nr:SDR family NAD(P)-dependent oxidoreductase [Wenzhouxiangellaceae bacterium]